MSETVAKRDDLIIRDKKKWLEYWAENMSQAEMAFNLIQQAKKAVAAVGHKQGCAFSGCTCQAVETFKIESAEFWRQIREFEQAISAQRPSNEGGATDGQ